MSYKTRESAMVAATTRYQPDLNSGCWLWEGAVDRAGYGKVSVRKASSCYVHRLAFEFHNGFRPHVVRHTCDTPACINPAHLLNGTHGDNAKDRVLRGRGFTGPRALAREVSDDVYRRIREGQSFTRILRETDVTSSSVASRIRRVREATSPRDERAGGDL